MSRWFRFYGEAMRHPKVARLSDKDFRFWVALLGIASENNGTVPGLDDLVLALRERRDYAERALKRFCDAALLEPKWDGYEPHNWSKHQYKSDTSTERVHKFRGKRNVSEPPDETPPETEADTDTEKKVSAKAESRPKRVRTLASEDFETGFWKPYPTTQPMSKAEAWKAWQKLGSEEREAVKSSIPDFVGYCRSNPDYPVVHACRYITKRKFEGFLPQANVVAFATARVFVEEGTPQWQAWKTYRLAHTGRPLNATDFKVGGVRKMGFYFESEWPPDATVTSTPPLPKLDEASASSRSASEREGQGRQATEARFAFSR